MEEKLTKLFFVAKEFSEKSEKHYVCLDIDFSLRQHVEILVRNKKSHKYVEIRKIYLKEISLGKLNEAIEFIKEYEV